MKGREKGLRKGERKDCEMKKERTEKGRERGLRKDRRFSRTPIFHDVVDSGSFAPLPLISPKV